MERGRVGLALCVLLAGALVHYGPAAERTEALPDGDDVASEYDAHVGETVAFWGIVESDSADALVVETGDLRLRVAPARVEANPGDAVQVFGTLRAGGAVDARRVVVSPRGHLRRMYLLSAVAALLALACFARAWRLDRDRLAFVARAGVEDRSTERAESWSGGRDD